MPRTRSSRREFLARAAATGTALSLAGCSGGGTGGEGTTERPGTTVEVGPDNEFVFRPGTDEPLRIDSGTTVTFVWKSSDHNVFVGSQPDGGDWEGTPGGKNETYDEGYTLEHEFTVAGTYHYWCVPHKSVGMIADIVVE